jgi:glycosyltransferase involved in cell wall biosynthesis
MAGPAIRAANIAAQLGTRHEVRLATTGLVEGPNPLGVDAGVARGRALEELARWAEVVVVQGWVLANEPGLADTPARLVADVYDPMHLEALEQGRDAGPLGHLDAVADCTVVLNHQLLRADFLLCASERQRDFWLGQLAGLGRINPRTYEADPTLRGLIDVIPFGLPSEPPTPGPGPRPPEPGERRILWGGGIYSWFDPVLLLHAVDRLRARVPGVRLEFLGLSHPSPDVPTMARAVEAREVSDRLGLTGTVVHFNEGWVPYAERGAHLLAAHVGVSTHLQHVETDFAFRTRLLDYLWARLPIVTSDGDVLADLVRGEGLGIVVPAGDEVALADALEAALTDEARRAQWRANSDRVAPDYEWSAVVEPLLRYCDAPDPAPDLRDPAQRRRLEPGSSIRAVVGRRADARRAIRMARSDGLGALLRVMGHRLRRVRSR